MCINYIFAKIELCCGCTKLKSLHTGISTNQFISLTYHINQFASWGTIDINIFVWIIVPFKFQYLLIDCIPFKSFSSGFKFILNKKHLRCLSVGYKTSNSGLEVDMRKVIIS